MTNKLVVIINSVKIPKIKKTLLYEMQFLVPNYSCLQNPWLWGLPPPDPCSLCPLSTIEFVEIPPPWKFPGYATAWNSPSQFAFWKILQNLEHTLTVLTAVASSTAAVTMVDCVWNVMAHAQKSQVSSLQPNGRVHLNRPVGFSSVDHWQLRCAHQR